MPGGENRTGGGEESPLRGRSDSVSSSRGLPNQPPVPSPLSSPHDYSRTSRAKSKFVSVPGEGSGVDFLGAEGNISRHNASQHRNSLRSGLFGRDDGSPSKAAELEEFSGSDVESSIGYSSLGSLDDSRMQDFSSPSELEDKDGQMDYKPDALAKSEYTDWVDINSENENFEAQFDSYQDKLNLANEKFQGILDGLLESFKRNFTEAVKGRIPGVTAGRTKLSILGPGKSKKAFKILMKEFDVLDDDDRMAASELNQGWQSSTVGASSGYDMTSQIFKFFKEYGDLKNGDVSEELQGDGASEVIKMDLGDLPPYLVNRFQDHAFRAFKIAVESMRSSIKIKAKRALPEIIAEGADIARNSYEKFKIENNYLLNHVAKRQVEAVRTHKSVGKSDESLNIAICEPALEPFESKVIPSLKIPGSESFEGMLLSRDQLEALRDIDRAFENYNEGVEGGGLRGKIEIRLPTGTGKSHLSRLLKDIYSTKVEEVGSVDLNSTEKDIDRLFEVSTGVLSLARVRGQNQAGLGHKKAQYVSIDESFFFARYFREKFLPEKLRRKSLTEYDDKDFAALEQSRVKFLRGLRRNGVVAITWGASEEPLKVRFEILRNKDKLLSLEKEYYDLKKELDEEKIKNEGLTLKVLLQQLCDPPSDKAKLNIARRIYDFASREYLSIRHNEDPISSFMKDVYLIPDVRANQDSAIDPQLVIKRIEEFLKKDKYSNLRPAQKEESDKPLEPFIHKRKKERAEKLASEIPRRKARVRVKEGYYKRLAARHKEVYDVVDNGKTALRKPIDQSHGKESFSVSYHIAQIADVIPDNVSGFAQYITDDDLNILQKNNGALKKLCEVKGLDAVVTIFKEGDESVKYKILELSGKETVVVDSEELKEYVSGFTKSGKKVLSIFDRKNYIGGDYKGFSSNVTFQGIKLSDNATENDYTQAIGRDRTPDFSRRRVSDRAFDRAVVSHFDKEGLKGKIEQETKGQAFTRTLGYGLAKSEDSKDKYTALRSQIDREGGCRSVYELFARKCSVEGANHDTAEGFFDKWEESINHYQAQYGQEVGEIEDLDDGMEEDLEEEGRLQAEAEEAAAAKEAEDKARADRKKEEQDRRKEEEKAREQAKREEELVRRREQEAAEAREEIKRAQEEKEKLEREAADKKAAEDAEAERLRSVAEKAAKELEEQRAAQEADRKAQEDAHKSKMDELRKVQGELEDDLVGLRAGLGNVPDNSEKEEELARRLAALKQEQEDAEKAAADRQIAHEAELKTLQESVEGLSRQRDGANKDARQLRDDATARGDQTAEALRKAEQDAKEAQALRDAEAKKAEAEHAAALKAAQDAATALEREIAAANQANARTKEEQEQADKDAAAKIFADAEAARNREDAAAQAEERRLAAQHAQTIEDLNTVNADLQEKLTALRAAARAARGTGNAAALAAQEAARLAAEAQARRDAEAKEAARLRAEQLEAERARIAAAEAEAARLAAGGGQTGPAVPKPLAPPITLTPIDSSDLLAKIEKTSGNLHSVSNRNTDRLLRNSKELQENGAQRNVAKTLVEIFNMENVNDRAKKFGNLGHASTMIKFAQEYGFMGDDKKSVKNAELAYNYVLDKDSDILKNLVEVRSQFNKQLEIIVENRKGEIESFDFDKYGKDLTKPKTTIENSVTTKAFDELKGSERSVSRGTVAV